MKARPLTATCQLQISGSGFINATISFPHNLSEVIKNIKQNKSMTTAPNIP